MIGIYTYYNPINYGAVLQALAMQRIIKEIKPEDEVGVIAYCPIPVKQDYKLLKTSSYRGLVLSLYNLLDNYRRHKVFERFISGNMNLIQQEKA